MKWPVVNNFPLISIEDLRLKVFLDPISYQFYSVVIGCLFQSSTFFYLLADSISPSHTFGENPPDF
jgi:hypothetical protein